MLYHWLMLDHLRDPSPAESFYVVHRSRPSGSSRRASPVADSPSLTARSDNASGKTPEELALENLNLRASLDEIASHAEKLERANKALQEQGEERDRAMRNIALGVRREVSLEGWRGNLGQPTGAQSQAGSRLDPISAHGEHVTLLFIAIHRS